MRNGVQRRLSWTSGGEVLGGSQLLRQDGHPRLHLSDPDKGKGGNLSRISRDGGDKEKAHPQGCGGGGGNVLNVPASRRRR